MSEWCKVHPCGLNGFELNRQYMFELKDTLRNAMLTFDTTILDDEEYKNMRYNSIWHVQLHVGDMIFSKLDSRINGEYLRQKDCIIVQKYKEIFENLKKVKTLELAEIRITELIKQECDTDIQEMLRHVSEMPDYYKVAVKPEKFTVPLFLDHISRTPPYQPMKIEFVAVNNYFEKIVGSTFYLQIIDNREKNNEIYDTNTKNYSCFARAYKQSVLGAGEYILADKCIYMFCNCDKDHSTDCIEYIFPSNILNFSRTSKNYPFDRFADQNLDKTISVTLYSGKALTSFAKKIRSGVYRFDFLPTNCNHYIFIKDFPTERESGCIVDLHWRTFSQEIHKDGLTFLVHFRNQVSYN